MANLYMALADQTRLRLLALMRDGEVCVGDFTDALGDSQPKISRHLAYLRNAGIVDTRRDGKWIHYSIRWPEEEGGRAMLQAALEWLRGGARTAPVFAGPESDPLGRIPSNNDSLDIYATTHMNEFDTGEDSRSPAHNDLEEFLL